MKTKLILIAYFTLCFLFLFSTTAHAYIDPSTTTFIIQAVAGIAVAIGAAVTVYWRKAKNKMKEKFNIDADKNKEVEDDIIVKDDTEK